MNTLALCCLACELFCPYVKPSVPAVVLDRDGEVTTTGNLSWGALSATLLKAVISRLPRNLTNLVPGLVDPQDGSSPFLIVPASVCVMLCPVVVGLGCESASQKMRLLEAKPRFL